MSPVETQGLTRSDGAGKLPQARIGHSPDDPGFVDNRDSAPSSKPTHCQARTESVQARLHGCGKAWPRCAEDRSKMLNANRIRVQTAYQTMFSVTPWPRIVPCSPAVRKTVPSVSLAAATHWSTASLTHIRTRTVRTRPPLLTPGRLDPVVALRDE